MGLRSPSRRFVPILAALAVVAVAGCGREEARRSAAPAATPPPTATPTARRCSGTVEGAHTAGIEVTGATAASCRSARRVMRAVGRWADSGRCFQDLCVRRHRVTAGYRCAVEKVGEADWEIACRRGAQTVTGFTAD